MLSDEGYNNQLNDVRRALTMWAETHDACARVQIDENDLYWRISAQPVQASLCPIELVLRTDRHYDLAIADAAVEDRPIEDFSLFPALFDAVAAGTPRVSTYRTAATGQLLATETLVPLPSREDWRVQHVTPLGRTLGLTAALVEEKLFAAYAPAGSDSGSMN